MLLTIADMDECTNACNDCHVNANCTNTVGSFNCTCKVGYTGNGRVCSGNSYVVVIFNLLTQFKVYLPRCRSKKLNDHPSWHKFPYTCIQPTLNFETTYESQLMKQAIVRTQY